MVTLDFVCDPAARDAVAALDVPAAPFTTPPDVVIARARSHAHQRLVSISVEGHVCGYFALETGPALAQMCQRADDVVLRTLAIDRAWRRKGVARAALAEALGGFVATHYPEARRVYLLVSEANWGAYRLYQTCGFRDTGLRTQGPWGRQRLLAHTIRNESPIPS